MRAIILIIVISLCFGATLRAESFRNLNFDEGELVITEWINEQCGYGPGYLLLPGWNDFEDNPNALVSYNIRYSTELPATTLDVEAPGMEGKYNVSLMPASGPGGPIPTELRQVGQIPIDALSIRYRIAGAPLDLFIAGNDIALQYQDPGDISQYVYAYGDISAYSGMNVELLFRTPSSGFSRLDSIQWLPDPIPEPTSWVLILAGSIVFLCARQSCRPSTFLGGRSSFPDGAPTHHRVGWPSRQNPKSF
ncbi:MAG TPA: hypothetical protein P5186_00930 [Candidatus Paceibacterota bacterium]|nr:hypothetical protein [Verrucomicrobiota bacterium]HRY46583.1 hypothetical protein [Candidatus Paceibacterota bacterium]